MITKSEIKSTFKGMLLGIGTWFIVLPLREKIVELSPIKSTLTIGIILLAIVLFWD